jgi:Methyltransferase domain
MIASRFGLRLHAVQGDMAYLGAFADGSFDPIFHPCSNIFAPSFGPVWRECSRVLRRGGILMWGFTKTESMLLLNEPAQSDSFNLRYRMPYSDLVSLPETELQAFVSRNEPLILGHSLQDQTGGLVANGFQLTDLFEDDWGGTEPLDAYFKAFVAARAVHVWWISMNRPLPLRHVLLALALVASGRFPALRKARRARLERQAQRVGQVADGAVVTGQHQQLQHGVLAEPFAQ